MYGVDLPEAIVDRTVDVRFFFVPVLLAGVAPAFAPPGAVEPALRMTLALKRFAITSIYGGMTITERKRKGYNQNNENGRGSLTFSLIPVAREAFKYVANLAVVFFLVDCSQVCDHQVSHADCLAPGARNFDGGEIDLRADRISMLVMACKERGKLLFEVHEKWGRLTLQCSRRTEPQNFTALLSHDHRMRVSCSYLDCLVLVHLALLDVELSW